MFDLSPTTNEKQGSKDSKRVAYRWHIPESQESHTKTGMSDIKAEGDSELESDVDNESWEHRDDSEDDTKPDTSIVVINMNKKKKSTGTKIGSSSRTKPVSSVI